MQRISVHSDMLFQSEKHFQSPQSAHIGPEHEACLAKQSGNAGVTSRLDPLACDIDIDIDTLPAICPPPYTIPIPALPTPYLETPPDFSTATIEGQFLELDDTIPVAQPPPKAPLNLRLPSFQMLGIAAPHPSDVSFDFDASIVPVGVGPLSAPHDPLHTMNPTMPVLSSLLNNFVPRLPGSPLPAERQSPSHRAVRQYVLTQTPPDDNGVLNWTADLIKSAASNQTNNQGGSHRIPASDIGSTPPRIPKMALTPPTSSFDSDGDPWISQALPSIRKFALANQSGDIIDTNDCA